MTDELTPQVPTEAPITAERPAEETPKLSNRDALQQAIADKRETPEAPRREAAPEPSTKAEVKEAMEDRVEPPAEFSAAAKKAWHDGDVKTVQKEFRRIQDERTKEVTRAQRAEREAYEKAKPMRDLAEKVRAYFAARGDDVPDDTKIIQAVNLVNQMRGTDRAQLKAELKAAGIDIDAAPTSPNGVDPRTLLETPEIKSLLTFKEDLIKEREEQQLGQVRNLFQDSISKLASQKTRTGEPVFPGFHDSSEAGIQFAKELGSLTREPWFQTGVLRRFPDADHSVLVREAYIHLGGRVSGDPVTVSPEKTQKHVEKSRRAAASTPGRAISRNESSNLIGKLSNRAAAERALAESREN